KFAMGIDDQGPVTTGIVQHPLSDVRRVVRAAKNKKCFVCGDCGATIRCAKSYCRRKFHLPCATDGECVTEFFGSCRSFCGKHRPQQTSEAAPAQGTNCTICLEPVGDRLSYHTMLCPVCKQAWFHRGCIQALATAPQHLFTSPRSSTTVQGATAVADTKPLPIKRRSQEAVSEPAKKTWQTPYISPTW
ncbi:hypothetical protein ASZ78_000500, partial [Callipepla squamata]